MSQLESSICNEMPSKRAAEPLSCEIKKKMPKLTNEEEATNSQIQELERELYKNDNYYRIMYLAREVVKAPRALSANLASLLLKFCVQLDSEDIARQLLENQDIDLQTLEGSELLWAAVDNGQEGIAANLIRSGAELSVRRYDDNRTILHEVLRSARLTRKEELVGLMLEHGADVNARDSEGHSLLHEAIKRDHCSIRLVENLLNYGAEVTISKALYMDDLRLACEHKTELLPRLVEHQVVDVETRNKRGRIAINCLISKDYCGAKGATAMRMMRKILELGVPVNSEEPLMDGASLFHLALWFKNKEAIKLLLDFGADPHQKDLLGHTSLFQAMKFKGYTHVSRWLIEKGVSIHARNVDGLSPIHGACTHESLRNIHLLLNLGADLNAIDEKGQTPFGMMKMRETLKCKEAHYLVIKHFALIIAKGGRIGDKDVDKIIRYDWSKDHFEKCIEQLERMKEEQIWKDVTYFSLFTRGTHSMMQLARNKNFVESFERDEKRRAELFPVYSYMILHSFEIAEKKLEMLMAEKKQLHEVFPEAMPDHIVENIAYYFCLERLERCHQDYYVSLHETLKNSQSDKAKII